jgi:hypothetical protein
VEECRGEEIQLEETQLPVELPVLVCCLSELALEVAACLVLSSTKTPSA